MWSVLPSRMGLTDPHEGEGPEVKGLRPGGRSHGHTGVWTEVSLSCFISAVGEAVYSLKQE